MKHSMRKHRAAMGWPIVLGALVALASSACSSHEGGNTSSEPGAVSSSYSQLANCAADDQACNQQAAQALHDAITGCFEDAATCKASTAVDGGGGDTTACHDELRACLEANRPPLPPCLEALHGCLMNGGDPWTCIGDARTCIRAEIAAKLADAGIGLGGHDEDEDGGCDHHGFGFGGHQPKAGGFFGGGFQR